MFESKKYKYLLLVLLLIASIGSQTVDLSAESNKRSSGRRRLATGAMRIEIDFSYADYKYSANGATDQAKYIFAKKLILKTKDLYTAIFLVKDPMLTNVIPEFNTTGNLKIAGKTISADLLTIFVPYSKADSTFASAAPHVFEPNTGRPIAGEFNINLNSINPTPANEVLHFGTFVHEFYHILVFNNYLYPKFVGADNKPIGESSFLKTGIQLGGKTRSGYQGPQVLNAVKNHINDNSLAYVMLENNGGDGSAFSHWAYIYWPVDFMSPIDTVPSLLTAMSLSMARDTGWFDYKTEL